VSGKFRLGEFMPSRLSIDQVVRLWEVSSCEFRIFKGKSFYVRLGQVMSGYVRLSVYMRLC